MSIFAAPPPCINRSERSVRTMWVMNGMRCMAISWDQETTGACPRPPRPSPRSQHPPPGRAVALGDPCDGKHHRSSVVCLTTPYHQPADFQALNCSPTSRSFGFGPLSCDPLCPTITHAPYIVSQILFRFGTISMFTIQYYCTITSFVVFIPQFGVFYLQCIAPKIVVLHL